jgi:hypothetical protein
LIVLATMLAMVLVAASPALAQQAANTDADQNIDGDTTVASSNDAVQNFFPTVNIAQSANVGNSGGGAVVVTQNAAPVLAPVQVPVSASVNAQQVPVTLAADLTLDALLDLF